MKGEGALRRVALVVGACGYRREGLQAIPSACKDASDFAALLREHYGFADEDVRVLRDGPGSTQAENMPTAQRIRGEIERLKMAVSEDVDFVFFYSGHGLLGSGADGESFGFLQPRQFDRSQKEQTGILMTDLRGIIKRNVRAVHLLIILDACHSGLATRGGDDEVAPEVVTASWHEPTTVVITAASSGESAWADLQGGASVWGGNSLMTRLLLDGLTPRGGRPVADWNADGVVVDYELASYLREQAPRKLRMHSEARQSTQTPQFRRFRDRAGHAGQFLFVPTRRD